VVTERIQMIVHKTSRVGSGEVLRGLHDRLSEGYFMPLFAQNSPSLDFGLPVESNSFISEYFCGDGQTRRPPVLPAGRPESGRADVVQLSHSVAKWTATIMLIVAWFA